MRRKFNVILGGNKETIETDDGGACVVYASGVLRCVIWLPLDEAMNKLRQMGADVTEVECQE